MTGNICVIIKEKFLIFGKLIVKQTLNWKQFFFQFSLKHFQVIVSNAKIEQNITPYIYIDFPLKMYTLIQLSFIVLILLFKY